MLLLLVFVLVAEDNDDAGGRWNGYNNGEVLRSPFTGGWG